MKNENKQILLLFMVIIAAKIILSYFIPSISAFSDEYYYAKMARSFFFEQDFSIHNIKVMFYQPLYPIVLSIAYLFKDMNTVYFLMKSINAIISTLVLIPIYLLAKEYLDNKKSLLLILTIGVMPAYFSFAPYLMAENLFYTLFAFFVYFFYKAVSACKTKYFILSGIFMAFVFLTKTSGAGLVIVPALYFLISHFIKKDFSMEKIKHVAAMYVVAGIIVLPWIIRNFVAFGSIISYNTLSDVTSYARHDSYVFPLINWILLYTGYIVIATGFVFGIIAFIGIKNNYKEKSKEGSLHLLIGLISIIYILMAANHAVGTIIYKTPISFFTERPIGRYVEMLLPLVLLLGFISFETSNARFKKYLAGTALLLVFSTQLAFGSLLLTNNLSLTHIGVFKYAMEYFLLNKQGLEVAFNWYITGIIAITIIILFMLFATAKKYGIMKVSALAITLFLATSLTNYGITYYNAKTNWFNSEQMQIGYFFNEYDKNSYSTLLIDSRDCTGKITRIEKGTLCENDISSIAGFFINDNIIVGNPEEKIDYDYLISKHETNLTIVKNIGDLYIYKNR